nr:RNA-dependent RNA polymerase [Alphapermutotetravirus sp.]
MVVRHPAMQLPEKRRPCKPQDILLVDLPKPFHQLQIPKQCLCNESKGLAERVLRVVPETESRALSRWNNALDVIQSQLRICPVLDEFSLMSCLPKSKKRQYSEALQSLLEAPLTTQDSHIKAFVKMEKAELIPLTELPQLTDMKDPRIIQARHPRFNVKLGKFTRAIETSIKLLRDPDLPLLDLPLIAKGHNLERRARTLMRMWNLMERPRAVSLDLSRWDMHVSEAMLLGLRDFYLKCYPSPLLRELLQSLTNNRCKTTQGIKYSRKSGVTSGDMTTALGNCLAVVASCLALRTLLGESVTDADVKWSRQQTGEGGRIWESILELKRKHNMLKPREMLMYDDGDDHILIVEEEAVPLIQAVLPLWWKLLGHKLTSSHVLDRLEELEFCQMKLCPQLGTMVPDPRKTVATSLCLTGNYRKDWGKYLHTVWRCRAMMHNGVPVLGPLFHRLSAQVQKFGLLEEQESRAVLMRQQYWMQLSHKLLEEEYVYQPPTAEARNWMNLAWKIDQETQMEMESLRVKLPYD